MKGVDKGVVQKVKYSFSLIKAEEVNNRKETMSGFQRPVLGK
jgi:hypothetical protein